MKLIAKYQVIEELGASAAGRTYHVRDPFRNREFALKLLQTIPALSEQAKQGFCEHLASCADLSHRQIAKICDMGEIEEGIFVVTEWRNGTDLRRSMEEHRELALDQKLALVAQVAEGLAFAHSRGIAHGDLKPSNIFVNPARDAAILDFGTASWLAALLSAGERPQDLLVNYLAPEQVLGQPFDARSDVFALGVMLYEFAAGKYPFTGEPSLIPREIVHSDPEPLSKLITQIPQELDELVKHALAKDPERRLQTAEEFASRLYLAAQTIRQGVHSSVPAETKPADALPLNESARVSSPESPAPASVQASPTLTEGPVVPQLEELRLAPAAFDLALPSAPAPRERPQDAEQEPRPWTARSYAASTPLPQAAGPDSSKPLTASTVYTPPPPVAEPEFQPPKSFLQPAIAPEEQGQKKKKGRTKTGRGVFIAVAGLVLAMSIVGSFISRQNLKASQSKGRGLAHSTEIKPEAAPPAVKQPVPAPSPVATNRAPKPGDSGPDDLGNREFLTRQTLNGPVRSNWESGRYAQALALIDEALVNDPGNEEALSWKKKIRAAQAAEAALK